MYERICYNGVIKYCINCYSSMPIVVDFCFILSNSVNEKFIVSVESNINGMVF